MPPKNSGIDVPAPSSPRMATTETTPKRRPEDITGVLSDCDTPTTNTVVQQLMADINQKQRKIQEMENERSDTVKDMQTLVAEIVELRKQVEAPQRGRPPKKRTSTVTANGKRLIAMRESRAADKRTESLNHFRSLNDTLKQPRFPVKDDGGDADSEDAPTRTPSGIVAGIRSRKREREPSPNSSDSDRDLTEEEIRDVYRITRSKRYCRRTKRLVCLVMALYPQLDSSFWETILNVPSRDIRDWPKKIVQDLLN